MIALISPAKTLDFDRPIPTTPITRPRLEGEAAALAAAAAKLSARKLGQLMHISPKLATLNVDRFRGFPDADERPAIFAFAGDVYTGFAARSASAETLAAAQRQLRILSGLYGLLRPFDAIRPYRLEMGTAWAPGRARDLYGWWGDRLGRLLADDLAAEGSDLIVNLASKEYAAAITPHLPAGATMVAIDFREHGPRGLRFNTFAGKKARGLMARWICEHAVRSMDALQRFDLDGYRFAERAADGSTLLFVRGEA